MTLAYVADDRSTLNGGGIQRWDWNGSAWVLTYTLNAGATVGARGLAVDFSGLFPTIYATTAEASNNRLIKLIDIGASSVEIDLATSGTTRAFRGLDFTPQAIPEPATCALLGLGVAGVLIFRRRK